jgi:hypothetical protein
MLDSWDVTKWYIPSHEVQTVGLLLPTEQSISNQAIVKHTKIFVRL